MKAALGLACVLLLAGCGQTPRPATPEEEARDLVARLASDDDNVRLESRLNLMRVGQPAVPFLLEALRNRASRVRVESAAALAGMTTLPADEVVPALTRAIDDREPRVRLNVLLALGKLGAMAAAAEPAIREALLDEDPRVRSAAAGALERLATAAGPSREK